MTAIIDNGILIIRNAGSYYKKLTASGKLKWDKKTQSLRGPMDLELLDLLAAIIDLPEKMEAERNRMLKIRQAVDKARFDTSPVPLAHYPVKASLLKHQVRGANMALLTFEAFEKSSRANKGFGFLFEMGCGKTLTAIAVAGAMYELGKIKRVLVVAPTSVCSVWPEEFNNFAKFKHTAVIMSGEKKKRLETIKALERLPDNGLKIAVINYESTFRDGIFETLEQFMPDMIICDESQRIKTHNASQSKAMHALGDLAKYKIILSGTPVQNNVVDLWSQYRFLDKSVFGTSFYAFKNKYCIMGGYGKHQIVGYRNMDELIKKEHSAAYRVTKEECLDLPEQTFKNLYVDFNKKERALYDDLRRSGIAELESGGTITAATVITKLLRLQQLTGGFIQSDDGKKANQVNTAKLDALSDILDDYVITAGKKLVVFARFRAEIDAIMKLFDAKGIRYGCIYGDIPIETRGSIVDDFQNNAKTMVFLAQLQTAGLGITLHAASAAVFYSMDFNYANYTQATARIHRIGQKYPCTYIHLMVKDSIDDKVLKAIQAKDDVAKSVVDNWRTYFE